MGMTKQFPLLNDENITGVEPGFFNKGCETKLIVFWCDSKHGTVLRLKEHLRSVNVPVLGIEGGGLGGLEEIYLTDVFGSSNERS